jgi:hypothetical protein
MEDTARGGQPTLKIGARSNLGVRFLYLPSPIFVKNLMEDAAKWLATNLEHWGTAVMLQGFDSSIFCYLHLKFGKCCCVDGNWFGIPECSSDAVEVRLFHFPFILFFFNCCNLSRFYRRYKCLMVALGLI